MSVRILSHDNDRLTVHGEISFNNVMPLRQQGRHLLAQCTAALISVDFSAVTRVDTVGLSLLIAWWRDAARLNKKVIYTHLPSAWQRMLNVCGIDFLLESRQMHC